MLKATLMSSCLCLYAVHQCTTELLIAVFLPRLNGWFVLACVPVYFGAAELSMFVLWTSTAWFNDPYK